MASTRRSMLRRPSARQQILDYYKEHLGEWIHNETFRELTGQNDVPRTIRTLRQQGWNIENRGDGYTRLRSLEQGPARGRREGISLRIRYEVLHRDNSTCVSCGATPQSGIQLVVDHIVPVDWGGPTEISNLQSLCTDCNQGKQAWLGEMPVEQMREIMAHSTVDKRIEALFDMLPNQEIPSHMVQLVSKGAFDWQRALRRVRQTTGKQIVPAQGRRGYIYHKEK